MNSRRKLFHPHVYGEGKAQIELPLGADLSSLGTPHPDNLALFFTS